MNFCMCGHVVIYSNFYQNPFMGFGATGGRNLPFPITLAICFYNSRDHLVRKTTRLVLFTVKCDVKADFTCQAGSRQFQS